MSKKRIKVKAAKLVEKYSKDINSKKGLVQEMNHVTMVHNANFGRKQFGGLELLNTLAEYRLESIFLNLSVSLRMFLCSTSNSRVGKGAQKRSCTSTFPLNPYLPRMFFSVDYLRGGPRRTLSLHVQYS